MHLVFPSLHISNQRVKIDELNTFLLQTLKLSFGKLEIDLEQQLLELIERETGSA
jgi:hypothetical protein